MMSAYAAWQGNFEMSTGRDLRLISVIGIFLWEVFLIITVLIEPSKIRKITATLVLGSMGSLFLTIYADILFLFLVSLHHQDPHYFLNLLPLYVEQEWPFYGAILGFTISVSLILSTYSKRSPKDGSGKNKGYFLVGVIMMSAIIIYPIPLLHILLNTTLGVAFSVRLPHPMMLIINSLYVISLLVLVGGAYYYRDKKQSSLHPLVQLINGVGVSAVLTLCLEILLFVLLPTVLSKRGVRVISGEALQVTDLLSYLPLILVVGLAALLRSIVKKKQFDDRAGKKETSGHFGTAQFAGAEDLASLNAYKKEGQIFIGTDDEGRALYLPLWNKLTISPPGGGKTSTSSIPALLSHEGPAFVFDVKGELWAVTARYRAEVFKRQVIVIDPFGVTKGDDFRQGKPEALLKEHQINPFDWIPSDRRKRDRMLNAFAASFVEQHSESTANHFDENAKILIRGYIDYLISHKHTDKSFAGLYYLMSESLEEAELTFQEMSKLEGRAAAAANQIKRVGVDERGSILSTSYRQIDWMGDSNIQATLAKSTFDLTDFLKGNMDIFVVLPEDQVKEHARLVRMLLAVLMGMIVQANPSDLPEKKMLFLLEELAQLGYCPDVEQCIEVLRARGVVVWTVFQTLSQIDLFKKPDLFKGARIKQIFTNDDTETMKWIQELAGKKTVLSKSLSRNEGGSRNTLQFVGGQVSKGEGESVQDVGSDLIQSNEIRELPFDEQWVFVHGARPLWCKKVRYFEHPDFTGKYDPNPLEIKTQK